MNLLVNYGIKSKRRRLQLVPIAARIFNYTGAVQETTLDPGVYTFEA
jgi:hypothetical protein